MNQQDKDQAKWSQAKAHYIETKGKGEADFSDADWTEINKLYNQMQTQGVGMVKSLNQQAGLSKMQQMGHKIGNPTSNVGQLFDKADPINTTTVVPGVSDMGIEVRRGDTRVKGPYAHGYSRVHEDASKHMDRAKEIARSAIKQLKEKRPQLTKAELDEAEDLLIKGAMQRIAPFNPYHVDSDERDAVEGWTGNEEDRDQIPQMDKPALDRGMHRLASQTQVRKAPDGTREFLLHRGMDNDEHNRNIKDGAATHKQLSSWTPNKKVAGEFAGHYSSGAASSDTYGKVNSAWVSEKNIHSIPHMIGSSRATDNIGKSPTGNEWEVIVKPNHNSPVVNTMTAEIKNKGTFGNSYHVPDEAKPSNVNTRLDQRASLAAMHKKLGFNIPFNPKPTLTKAEELDKGQNGDWKAEGYTIHHEEGRMEHPGSTLHHIEVRDKDGRHAAHFKFRHNTNEKMKGDHVEVRDAVVDSPHRRKGIATAAYCHIENVTGSKIRKEPATMSQSAHALHDQPNKPFGKSLTKSEIAIEMLNKALGIKIKPCPTCKTKLTTSNAKYIGEQELPEHPDYDGQKMSLYNCPKCDSTVAHVHPK